MGASGKTESILFESLTNPQLPQIKSNRSGFMAMSMIVEFIVLHSQHCQEISLFILLLVSTIEYKRFQDEDRP